MPRHNRLTRLETDILAVALADAPVHGFGIAQALRDEHGRGLTAHGTLYKALGRLVAWGLLERWWEPAEDAEAAGRPRRRLYRITATGRAALAQAPAASAPVRPERRTPGTAPGTVTP